MYKEYIAVTVWDWQTRVLHWMNALLVITLALLGLSMEGMEWLGVGDMEDQVKRLHAYIGYVFVLTLTLRIIWGFIGNEYARWLDIIPYKKERWQAIWGNIRWYIRGFKGEPSMAIGHNPLASLFYMALFLVLISQAVTGLSLATTEGLNPFYASISYGDEEGIREEVEGFEGDEVEEEGLKEVAEEVHEFGLWFIIFFLCAHLAGLVVHEIGEGAGLFSSMISGRKYFPKDEL